MLTIEDRLAYRIVTLGADIISTGSHLRETGDTSRAVDFLKRTIELLPILKFAAEALGRGDEEGCRQVLSSLRSGARRDSGVISPAILDALELPS